jgi:hypothetical protein
MIIRIIEFLKGAGGEITYGIRCLCGKPSPMKRFMIVVVAGALMGIASFWILVSSVYNIGHSKGQKEIVPELNMRRQLNVKNDSINLLKQQLYEYGQEQSDK